VGKLLAGKGLDSGSEGCLHNSAGCAEDDARAGVDSQRLVKLLVGKRSELYSRALYHPAKLACGDGYVHVRNAVCVLVGTSYLKLLRGAGHYGYHHNVSGVYAVLLGIVALCNRAEHLLGRL